MWSKSECLETDEVSVLLLLSWNLCEGVDTGGEGAALPVIKMLLNASTSMAGLPGPDLGCPSPSGSPLSCCSSRVCCRPIEASFVANVRANGLFGAPGTDVPSVDRGGSEPEFRLVFWRACSRSESAVAVESESSSSGTACGGGGDIWPEDSRRGTSSGDCGGVCIFTVFFFVEVLIGAALHQVSHLLPSHPKALYPLYAVNFGKRTRCRRISMRVLVRKTTGVFPPKRIA